MTNYTKEPVENTATKIENTEINEQKDTTLNNSELNENSSNLMSEKSSFLITKEELDKICELDENSNTTKSNNISLEEKLILDKIIYAQSINKTPIIIKEINVGVNVELSIYEKEAWLKNMKQSLSTIVTKDIENLIKMFLLIDKNDSYEFIFDNDSTINFHYTQSYNENSNEKNSTINIKLIQREWKYCVDLDKFYKTFEYILPNNLFPNYLLNTLQDFIKSSKKNTDYEEKRIQNKLNYAIKSAQKELSLYNKISSKKINDFTKKIVNDIDDSQSNKRWESRLKNWVNFLNITVDKNKNLITSKNIFNFNNFNSVGVELELLSDVLDMEIADLRRYIKKVEDITQKKLIVIHDTNVKFSNEDNIKDKNIIKNFKKAKSLLTIDWFFTILSFIKANNFN